MAYTFKKILDNVNIGNSLYDKNGSQMVLKIAKICRERNVQLHLPIDHVIGEGFSEDATVGVTNDLSGIPKGWLGLDIGPKTKQLFATVVKRAKTIIWNGPMGKFEWPAFASGTLDLMCEVVEATNNGCITVIGGGDTGRASSVYKYNNQLISKQLTHVSTGGGSSLVLMEGKMLPAVTALSNK